jgi:dTDP-4-dehydrorhamnose 3,5-epimerase
VDRIQPAQEVHSAIDILRCVRFEATRLGAVILHPESHVDERGAFTRTFCETEFEAHGIGPRFPQCNLSTNSAAGTLRGMHINVAGHWESKLVRCVRGAIYDVIVDLRPGSPSHGQWLGVELSATNALALYVPEGCAHGFVTLEDRSDIYYHMGRMFEAGVAVGFRWNDPAFGIEWPVEPQLMSERDRTYPDFAPDLLERGLRLP